MCNIQDKIDAYAAEINGDSEYKLLMTIDSLINSHRTLREWSMRTNEERNAELQKMRDHVAKQTRESIQHGEFVSIERLKSMTMNEIAELLISR